MVRRILVGFLLMFMAAASASTPACFPVLEQTFGSEGLSAEADGRDALQVLRSGVELVEPVLPPLRYMEGELALAPDDSGYDDLLFLSERRLLPSSWEPDTLSADTWQGMLERFADWYDVSPAVSLEEPLTREMLVDSLASLIGQITPQLKPVALIALDPSDQNRVEFWAIIRNDGPYPRLIVERPPEEALDLNRRVENALPYLASCAVSLRNYIAAPLNAAQQLFLAHNEARMVIARSAPLLLGDLYEVPAGDEPEYLRFAHEEVDGVDRFAALFVGPGPGMWTITRILPSLRTNMGPGQIYDFIQAP